MDENFENVAEDTKVSTMAMREDTKGGFGERSHILQRHCNTMQHKMETKMADSGFFAF